MALDAYIARDIVTPNPFDMGGTVGSLLMFDPKSDIGSNLVSHDGLSAFVRPGTNTDRIIDELSMGPRYVDRDVLRTCLGRAGCVSVPVPDGLVIAGPYSVDMTDLESEAARYRDWLAGDVYSIFLVASDGPGGTIVDGEPPKDASITTSLGAVFGTERARSEAIAMLERYGNPVEAVA